MSSQITVHKLRVTAVFPLKSAWGANYIFHDLQWVLFRREELIKFPSSYSEIVMTLQLKHKY